MNIYLAIPYSFDPEKSFSIANEVAAVLMSRGHTVFSPVSHSHCIADHLPENLRRDWKFWKKQDLPLINWADEVHVVLIHGEKGRSLVKESTGVQAEIEHAQIFNKPIKYYYHYE